MITLVMLIMVGSAIAISFVWFDPLNLEFSLFNNPQEEMIETNPPRSDITGTSDKVTLKLERSQNSTTRTAYLDNWFNIETAGQWTGDIVDGYKKPRPIKGEGFKQLFFDCYYDNFYNTRTYFGAFQNAKEPLLMIEVFIDGQLTEVRSTERNRALIVEGNC